MKHRLITLVALAVTASPALGQNLTEAQQIAAAIAALPDEYRSGAEVRAWTDGGLRTIRPGSNRMVCLADQPGDDRFHVACYHDSLEPFMKRGRELREEGLGRDDLQRTREEEVESGKLKMPDHPAALYSLSGPAGSFDADSLVVRGASPLYVLYMPFATTESTGLPERAPRGQPWLMNPGKPWAHVMLIPPAPEADN